MTASDGGVPPHVVVLGGGISGLTTAYRLGAAGARVTLLEAGDQLGGLGTFFEYEGISLERFYHCVMPSDSNLLPLLDELGLANTVAWRDTTMGMIVDRTRQPFNTAIDLLRFTPLRFDRRVRFGAVSLLLRRLGRSRDLDNLRTEDWLRGLYGDDIWERMFVPMFGSKFGSAFGDVPALYLWQRLGRERNVAVRGYPSSGYESVIDALAAAIRAFGGDVRTGTPVVGLSSDEHGALVETSDGTVAADWVVSTLPLPTLRGVADEATARWLPKVELRYQGVVNAVFFLRRPLDGHYWSPVINSGTEFDGVIEMSALTGAQRYGDRHVVYVMRYTDRDSDLFAENDAAILDRWTEQLIGLYPDLDLTRADIADAYLFKAPFVEPVYPLGYRRKVPAIDVSGTRVMLATTTQIYPEVTSWNSSVGLANRVADTVLSRIQSGTYRANNSSSAAVVSRMSNSSSTSLRPATP